MDEKPLDIVKSIDHLLTRKGDSDANTLVHMAIMLTQAKNEIVKLRERVYRLEEDLDTANYKIEMMIEEDW